MTFLQGIFGTDLQAALIIIINLILIESLLSVDNAALIATMVMDLPKNQRGKALRYGILGAYVFRGLCLVFAVWLVNIWWLKPLGGFYLLYISIKHFVEKSKPHKEEHHKSKEEMGLYQKAKHWVGPFWSTVIMVEIMDLAFSIDNVFAAVAFSNNIILIMTGVFIGILAMRFVAQFFVSLMEKFPFLETIAFSVIAVLGVKLSISLPCEFFHNSAICNFLHSEKADLFVSLLTVLMFIIPVSSSLLFNYPKRGK
jgi:YkoY family integral membrane protein